MRSYAFYSCPYCITDPHPPWVVSCELCQRQHDVKGLSQCLLRIERDGSLPSITEVRSFVFQLTWGHCCSALSLFWSMTGWVQARRGRALTFGNASLSHSFSASKKDVWWWLFSAPCHFFIQRAHSTTQVLLPLCLRFFTSTACMALSVANTKGTNLMTVAWYLY